MSMDWLERYEHLQPQVRNFVAGAWQPASAGEKIEKRTPRDGRLIATFGSGVPTEANAAIASARQAFEAGGWSRTTSTRRKEILFKLAELIDDHREELALLECVDVGKPISDAYNFDVPVASATIRANAELADKLSSKVYTADATSLSYQLRRPIGVVAGIVGWNFPLALASQKIGPVLAAGNSLVLKPSELTSLAAARVAELAIEAGVPKGVFNVVHGGPAIGDALARHPDVDLLTFTGSSRTGKQLLIASGQSNMKRLILECGGKAPNIVFDDCPDIEAVADAVLQRAFWNQGQVCTASSRLLVHEPIKQDLLAILVRKAEALRVGDPLDPATKFGAMVSAAHKEKVEGFIKAGSADGATVAFRSSIPAPHAAGFYVPATIFSDVASHHRIAQEEIFGPVLSVISFENEAEAIKIANDTHYGLSAIVWTRDIGRAHRMTQGIHAGWVIVNAIDRPAGGPGIGLMAKGGHKQSGIGVEGGFEGLEALMSNTAVQVFA